MKPIENMEEFEANVIQAYRNAMEGDWFTPEHTARDIALDMIAFDATLEEYEEDDDDNYDEDMIAILIPIINKVHNIQ